ncbi:hypothetical protein C8N28_0959 [Albibacterium bauzanense]|uniref:Uncharacterized protein n=2 Tax=Albibacterium bauzanense TaxID=653929 RepID=A0A4R1M2K1_9SPHI|nr:hypothetical protein C8N28_0959 [Albibacterium bauzanense]
MPVIYKKETTMTKQRKDNNNIEEDNKFNEGKEDSAQDLKYNAEEDSFELDVEGDDDDEYTHENPYDTVAEDGDDMDSDWDEANLNVGAEYEEFTEEEEVEKLGMHIDRGQIVELDPLDEKLAETPEDKRSDLDEEGYPKNDT